MKLLPKKNGPSYTLLGLLLLALALGWHQHEASDRTAMTPLRVDYPVAAIHPEDWDPAASKVDYQVSMVVNLYSPLLEMDVHAQLKSGWATHFSWEDAQTLTLDIRQDARLADGSLMTAEDAAGSLKRMAFLLQEDGEGGYYVEQFCHTKRLIKLSDPCPGLIFKGQRLTIRTQDPVAILPELLTHIETSLVPQAALETDGLTLKKVPKTSGPYSVVEGSEDPGHLVANPLHFNYSQKMPQDIKLLSSVDATPESLAEAFAKGSLDHVAMFSALNGLEFESLAKKLGSEVSIHRSLPMGLGLFYVSEQARKRLPIAERQYLAVRVQTASHKCLATSEQARTRKPTTVLIPSSGVGALTAQEQDSLDAARKNLSVHSLQQSVTIKLSSIYRSFHPCLSAQLSDLPIEFMDPKSPASEQSPPDLTYGSYDMSTYEELSFIRSLMSRGWLQTGSDSADHWIRQFVTEQQPNKRMQQLKEAQLRAIWTDLSVIPIWNYDAGALTRRPWTMNFSSLNFFNPLYQLRYEP